MLFFLEKTKLSHYNVIKEPDQSELKKRQKLNDKLSVDGRREMKNDEANLTPPTHGGIKNEHNKVSHETKQKIPTNHSLMYT